MLARTYVFNKQSLLSIHCNHPQPQTPVNGASRGWPPFSQSYGGNLPSSLTTIHSNALVYSTQLPVSVYGTGDHIPNVEAFLDKTGSPLNPHKRRFPSVLTPQNLIWHLPGLPRRRATTLDTHKPPVCNSYHFASPLLTRSPPKTTHQTNKPNPKQQHHKSATVKDKVRV